MTKEGVSRVRAWGKNKSNRRRRKRKDELLGTIHCLWRGGKRRDYSSLTANYTVNANEGKGGKIRIL